MIIVSNTIVSDDIADCRFSCCLTCCHGACCIEGDSGAPLQEEEVSILQEALPDILPYMTPQGIRAVNEQGVAVRDAEGDLGTPLINDTACAYITYDDNGVALCAIEKAYRSILSSTQPSLQDFGCSGANSLLVKYHYIKPISCHLYPIRVEDYGEFIAVNYHRWDICRHAQNQGQPLYIYLKQPLIRRFGAAWYDDLIQQIKLRNT